MYASTARAPQHGTERYQHEKSEHLCGRQRMHVIMQGAGAPWPGGAMLQQLKVHRCQSKHASMRSCPTPPFRTAFKQKAANEYGLGTEPTMLVTVATAHVAIKEMYIRHCCV